MLVHIVRNIGQSSIRRNLSRQHVQKDSVVQGGALAMFVMGVAISSFSLRKLALQARALPIS